MKGRTVDELIAVGETAVRRLRKHKLDNGRPFLIWSSKLPKDQSYLEYPDRSIKIVIVSPDLLSFSIIDELSDDQARILRRELNLHE